ncbi:flagellar assembly peptidoglycan hydrolase FlgJ [Oceanospirillum linum]|uniref:Peptidoglycan hydrolase FlgJ n=1 Tax=Oceanospirillum linum TaxID=966 RepID=A0A1T1HFI7_OCELI|nr:flagellar assembly peptidoglycan hydrolase FlgJ [Oceanospirillum linum]OOV88603.1 flagellar rod assembly protein/muramidase FlgJ [Oceanospirillum linum]SEG05904.1 flagellar protein FlgJ [Oleiphilus messinensis]SMP20690.1 flagellar protein FlgJ [Oceanospirillum linum]
MINSKYDQARVVTDVQGLESLRKGAREDDPEALKEVARQFEAMMVQMIMKNARQSNELLSKDGIFDSEQVRFYQQMFDEQMAVTITEGGTFGLADVLVRQLSKDYGLETEADETRNPKSIQEMLDRGSRFPASRYDPELMQSWRDKFAAERAEEKAALAEANMIEQGFDSPQDFITSLYPAAEKAAEALGLDPKVMLSQAALETGWGRYMIRDESGKNSFNLFGIKADSRWDGESAVVSTLEYRGGVAQREQAAFRAYGSYEESLKDYANFLQSNPRYTEALKRASDPVLFTKGLQDAGYATDPAYAQKIQRIINSSNMTLAVKSDQNSQG